MKTLARVFAGCILVSCAAALFKYSVVTMIEAMNTPPTPSPSLLSFTGTAGAVNITAGGASCAVRNLTAVFSMYSRNKVPVIYSDFQLRGRQYENIKWPKDFITASAASALSLERSGESTDTIALSVPNASVIIESWSSVNETMRTGISYLHLVFSLNARYAGRRWTIPMHFICGWSYGHELEAEIVAYSGNQSPELNFSKDVFHCSASSPFLCSLMLGIFCLAISIFLGLATHYWFRYTAALLNK